MKGYDILSKKTNNIMYTFFYTIFSIWPWRTLYGIILGIIAGIGIGTSGMNIAGAVMFWIMLIFAGWWVAYLPAKITTSFLKKAFTK